MVFGTIHISWRKQTLFSWDRKTSNAATSAKDKDAVASLTFMPSHGWMEHTATSIACDAPNLGKA